MKKRNKKGFTLLEVMLALSIISISLVVIINSFSQAIAVKSAVSNYTKAMFLSQKKLFEININNLSTVEKQGKFIQPFEQFNWQINSDSTNFSELAKVDLTIEWNQQGKSKNIQVSAIMEK
ncbi:MAG: prepilin-type N-terminal cleavage/methylation domain-containing protein [Candidatus Omnitrophica bacterium]|nr:prepilin-type N-terminal cleavage/methylation domain-containing protein [Candidatus Omnitrophota bacterium]